MEIKTQPTNSTPELTSEIAQAIFAKIVEYGNADKAYKSQADSAYDPEHFQAVDKEADRISAELAAYKSGSKVITPAVPAVYDEEGNVTTEAVPAVCYEYTTDEDLLSQVTSDLLDVESVYDIM